MNQVLLVLCFIVIVKSNTNAQTTKIEAENWSSQSGVLTENCSDVGGGLNVGWIDQGDYMNYAYTAPSAGSYTIRFRIATPNSCAQFRVKSGSTILTTINVPSTGGNQIWQTVSATITLSSGSQTITLQSSASAGWNFNWLELVAPSGGGNQQPTVNAGPDQTITLPTSQVNLSGTASDPDGTISTYTWTRVSGPTSSTITSASSATTTVTGLVEGVYVFRLTVTDNGGGSAYDDLNITVNAAPVTGGWSLNGNTASASQFIGTTNTQDLLFKAGNHSWARLKTDGTFETNKLKVRTDTWADYVFDSTYQLRPLNEVKMFIEKNKHLPDVPSAEEVFEKGLNIGDNQAVLLRKIEELTLYLIEQNKELQRQQQLLQKQAEEIEYLKRKAK